MSRFGTFERKTKETSVSVRVNLDGPAHAAIATPIGFFNHMLTLMAFHAGIDLTVKAEGDTDVDGHHTVEDVGIGIGRAMKEAVGSKAGIGRYGESYVPMNESLARVVLDFCGRPELVFQASIGPHKVGEFDVELGHEFFRALCTEAGITAHIDLIRGSNAHHMLEAIFKAFGRAFGQSVRIDPARAGAIPSTKGVLE